MADDESGESRDVWDRLVGPAVTKVNKKGSSAGSNGKASVQFKESRRISTVDPSFAIGAHTEAQKKESGARKLNPKFKGTMLHRLGKRGLFSKAKLLMGSTLVFSSNIKERIEIQNWLAPEYSTRCTSDPEQAKKLLAEKDKILLAFVDISARSPRLLREAKALLEYLHGNETARMVPVVLLLPEASKKQPEHAGITALVARACGELGIHGWIRRPFAAKAVKDRATLILMANRAADTTLRKVREGQSVVATIRAEKTRLVVPRIDDIYKQQTEVERSHLGLASVCKLNTLEGCEAHSASGVPLSRLAAALHVPSAHAHARASRKASTGGTTTIQRPHTAPSASKHTRHARFSAMSLAHKTSAIGHALDASLQVPEMRTTTLKRVCTTSLPKRKLVPSSPEGARPKSSSAAASSARAFDVLMPPLRFEKPDATTTSLLARISTQIGSGLEYFESGRYELALREFHLAAGIDARSVLAHTLCGVVRAELARYVPAIRDFDTCMRLLRGGAATAGAACDVDLDEEGEDEDGHEFGMLETRKKERDTLFNRAVTYVRMGCDARALHDLQRAHKLVVGDGTGDQEVLRAMGLVQRRIGAFDASRETYRRVAELGEPTLRYKKWQARKRLQAVARLRKGRATKLIDDGTLLDEHRRAAIERVEAAAKEQQMQETMERIRQLEERAVPGAAGKRQTHKRLSQVLNEMGMQNGVHQQLFVCDSELEKAMDVRPERRVAAQRQKIAVVVSQHPFFRHFPQERAVAVAGAVEYVRSGVGDWIVREGERADRFYLVLSGRLLVKQWKKPDTPAPANQGSKNGNSRSHQFQRPRRAYLATVNAIEAGGVFGEISLLRDYLQREGAQEGLGASADGKAAAPRSKRTAGLVVDSAQAELLCIGHEVFLEFVAPWLVSEITRKTKLLKEARIWKSWEPSLIDKLATVAQLCTFRPGDFLELQGMETGALLVLTRGVCSVRRYPDPLAEQYRAVQALRQQIQEKTTGSGFHHFLVCPTWPDRAGAALRRDMWYGHHDTLVDTAKEKWHALEQDIDGTRQQLARMEDKLKAMELEAQKHAQLQSEVGTYVKAKANKFVESEAKAGRPRNAHVNKYVKVHKEIELRKVMPPAVLGEQTVLRPKGGSLVTVVAETFVEVITISKELVRQWKLTDALVNDLKRASVIIPADDEVEREFDVKQEWGYFRSSLMKHIPKSQWPVAKERIRKEPGGTTTVVPEKEVFGPRRVRWK
eukprot:g221.t1